MFVVRLFAMLSGHKLIRLVGEPRVGGYVFVKSPDLPGFSLMLHPSEAEDPSRVFAAIYDPVIAFIEAEFRAGQIADGNRVRLTSFKQTTSAQESTSYLAEMCRA